MQIKEIFGLKRKKIWIIPSILFLCVLFWAVFSMGADVRLDEITEDSFTVTQEYEQTILIWEYDRGTSSFLEALTALAEKASRTDFNGKKYHVVAVAVPKENYDQELLEVYLQGNAPDIVMGDPQKFSFHTEVGVVIDLAPILLQWEAEENTCLEEVPQLAWNLFQNGKIQMGIPVTQTGYGIVYNKEIFEQAQIKELPGTYEEWYRSCDKISEMGIIPWINGTEEKGTPDLSCLVYWLGTNRASILNDRNQADMGNAACQEVWEFLERNYKKNYQPLNILQYTEEEARTLFLSGEAAIYAGGIPTFIENNSEKYGVLPMPCGSMSMDDPNHPISYQGYYGIRSNHSRETLEVLKWWYEHSAELWTEYDADRVPCKRELADAVYGDNKLLRDWMDENLFTENTATIFYPQTSYPDYANELFFRQYLTDIMTGVYSGGTIQEGVLKANYEIDHLLEKYIIP